MKKSFKTLCLALMAVLALGVVAASGAYAAEAHFTSETGTAKIEGSSAGHRFTTTAGAINCNGVFNGTVSSLTTTEQTVTPKYEGCEFLGAKVNVEMHSCDYVFNAGTYGPGAGTSVGTAAVKCNVAGDFISFAAPGCEVRVAAQSGLTNVHYATTTTEATGKEDVVVTPEINNIKYTHSGLLCGTGSGNTGTYTAPATTMKGLTSKGAQTNVTITST